MADVEEIVKRRYGRRHEKPCAKPDTLSCSLWECQERDRCRFLRGPAVVIAFPGARYVLPASKSDR